MKTAIICCSALLCIFVSAVNSQQNEQGEVLGIVNRILRSRHALEFIQSGNYPQVTFDVVKSIEIPAPATRSTGQGSANNDDESLPIDIRGDDATVQASERVSVPQLRTAVNELPENEYQAL